MKSTKDDGLVILGFPCNQFGGQEPGGSEQIATFCEKNYGVTFPMFSKIDVNWQRAVAALQVSQSERSQAGRCPLEL